MNKFSTEFFVGLFVIVGMIAVGYLSINLAGLSAFGNNGYTLIAKFENSSGLKNGAFIELAGVRVGKVKSIILDKETYLSFVKLSIDQGIEISDDSIASIRTAGIIGDKFIKITLGGSDDLLQAGGEIIETEPSISIEELVSKYIFEK